MPTARLSTGKTVAPLRPPRMHTLRGVQLRATAFYPFPVRDEVVLEPGLAIDAARVVLGDRLSYELPTDDLGVPAIQSLPAALERPWLAAEPLLPAACVSRPKTPVHGQPWLRAIAGQPEPEFLSRELMREYVDPDLVKVREQDDVWGFFFAQNVFAVDYWLARRGRCRSAQTGENRRRIAQS